MKNTLKLLIAMLAVGVVACETYKVDDPDTTVVAPLDGRYICWAYDYDEYVAAADKSTVEPVDFFETRICATTDNDTDKVWIYVTSFLNTYPFADCVAAKIPCNVGARSFSAVGVENEAAPAVIYNWLQGQGYYTLDGRYGLTPYSVTVTEGHVVLNGYDTPTGYKADAISFGFERVALNEDGEDGKFMVVGHRYTGWAEDYEEFTKFIDGE